MTPETPPTSDPSPERPRGDPPFGPEARAAVERALTNVRDPDAALRLLASVDAIGAGFAAYLTLRDTDPSAPGLVDTFQDSYVDAWQHFAQFRTDVLEGLGWLDALTTFTREQGIPGDHLAWNHPAIDAQIRDTYDLVHLDGWWHVFYR